MLGREVSSGADHAERLSAIAASRAAAQSELAAMEIRWKRESGLVEKDRGLRDAIESGAAEGDAAGKLAEIGACSTELEQVQGQTPLVRVFADTEAVSDVISGWTGIPVGKMVTDEIQGILNLPAQLQQRVIGQDHAMDAIHQRIQTSRANLEDPNKPVGVFMLIGPSGVGKTETALALADLLYGGERNLITINLSEFGKRTHSLYSEGRAPGLRGLRRGRRADRGGSGSGPTRWCFSMKLKRLTRTCSNCSSGFSTRESWKTAKDASSVFGIRSSC